ncbi:unnamed protein product, partial [Leptidea sinapis]
PAEESDLSTAESSPRSFSTLSILPALLIRWCFVSFCCITCGGGGRGEFACLFSGFGEPSAPAELEHDDIDAEKSHVINYTAKILLTFVVECISYPRSKLQETPYITYKSPRGANKPRRRRRNLNRRQK